MKVAILRIEGTNCEEEMRAAFQSAGFDAEHVHLKQFTQDCARERHRDLFDYDVLMVPGGWSAGDYVRAGAIFAARMKSRLGDELSAFVSEGRLIGGVCNGFQVLIELGLLPGTAGISDTPQAALAGNLAGFQCRPVYLRHESPSPFTHTIEKGAILQIPVANGEGRLTFGKDNEQRVAELEENDQVVFRYCRPDGSDADLAFPWNPSNSVADIAGICNRERTVFGMMPHPERVMHSLQMADWTRRPQQESGDGRALFESIAESVRKNAI